MGGLIIKSHPVTGCPKNPSSSLAGTSLRPSLGALPGARWGNASWAQDLPSF